MKALQKASPSFGLELREVAAPEGPGPDEVVVAVAATGVCGTDVHIYEWTPGYEAMTKAMPVTLGHEFSGTVAAVGSDVWGVEQGRPRCGATLGSVRAMLRVSGGKLR